MQSPPPTDSVIARHETPLVVAVGLLHPLQPLVPFLVVVVLLLLLLLLVIIVSAAMTAATTAAASKRPTSSRREAAPARSATAAVNNQRGKGQTKLTRLQPVEARPQNAPKNRPKPPPPGHRTRKSLHWRGNVSILTEEEHRPRLSTSDDLFNQ